MCDLRRMRRNKMLTLPRNPLLLREAENAGDRDAPLCSPASSSTFPCAALPGSHDDHGLSLSPPIGAFYSRHLATRRPQVRHQTEQRRDEHFGIGTDF